MNRKESAGLMLHWKTKCVDYWNRAAQPDVTGDLQESLTWFFTNTRAAIEVYVSDVFDGRNTTEFEKQFGTGVWASSAIQSAVNDTDFDTEMSAIYFGMLTVPAWNLRQHYPVLMCVTVLSELAMMTSSLTQRNGRYDDKDSDCSAPDPFRDDFDSYDGKLHSIFDSDDVSVSPISSPFSAYPSKIVPTVHHPGVCLLRQQEILARWLDRRIQRDYRRNAPEPPQRPL